MNEGIVIWITGLSGAGKTTLANALVSNLKREKKNIIKLDGDEVRKIFGYFEAENNNHDREFRIEIAKRYSNLCLLLAKQGFTVIISTISMFKEIHKWNREKFPRMIEVYIKASIEDLKKRDSKRIYSRYRDGEISNVAGLDLNIDEPEGSEIVVKDFDLNDIKNIVYKIKQKINEN